MGESHGGVGPALALVIWILRWLYSGLELDVHYDQVEVPPIVPPIPPATLNTISAISCLLVVWLFSMVGIAIAFVPTGDVQSPMRPPTDIDEFSPTSGQLPVDVESHPAADAIDAPLEGLKALLVRMFSPSEFRIFLGRLHLPSELRDSLVEAGVSHLSYVDEAVDALQRRGLIDKKFWSLLERERPYRTSEIAELRLRFRRAQRET